MKRAILVTGGAGYIGSHVAYAYAQAGFCVVIVDHALPYDQSQMPWAIFVRADYADPHVLARLFTTYAIDCVIHCAAFIEVGVSQQNPDAFYHNNVIKQIQLLDIMRQYGVSKFIFSSSCAVYGNPQAIPIDESHPRVPVSAYGNTKLCNELVVEDYARAYGLSYVGLRYFNAAGANPCVLAGERHEPETHLIPLLLHAMIEKKPIMIFGDDYATPDGSCLRDYVHVIDIGSAHVRAYDYLMSGGKAGFFNLGTGVGISVKELIACAQTVTGLSALVQIAQRRAGDADRLIANPTKAQALLQWQPVHSSIDEIITTAYIWQQQWLGQRQIIQGVVARKHA